MTQTHSSHTGSRIVLWLVLLLSLLLLGGLTVFAVSRNPLYSDVGRNKLSKYRFIEECKSELGKQLTEINKTVQGGAIRADFDPRRLVAGVANNPQGAGWVLGSQFTASRAGAPSQDVPFLCQSDAQGKVQLQVAQ
ncbi:hypothetical protein [Deinococcus sonorensis]|uniref:Uncharacterized protein n=2 Tax=Deinococcus sonorensis TaxID=309891 RepID=A0AAU7UC14_9DEIO